MACSTSARPAAPSPAGKAERLGRHSLPELELPGEWEARTEAIDAYLSGLESEDIFSGVALIVERGEVRYEAAYGLASREFDVPNTVQTRFDVGSFNKDYTQLAILQLLEQDKLALSDTVGRYLPEYPNARVRDEVTIEQLMEHRSGLGDYFTPEWRQTPMGSLREIEDYIPIWGPKPLEYEPGSREQYSNFGYTVLGAIIEAISGMSYPEYVEEHVFEPAGMAESGFFETDIPEPDVAVGYSYMQRGGRRTDTLRKNIYMEPVKGGPWGKSYSTARDLYRFFAAMFEDRLLDRDLNWLRGGWDSGGIALAGGGPGLNAYLLLQNGRMVIVMANLDPPIAGNVAERLKAALEDSD